MAQRTCSIDGCDRPHVARGWCSHHYERWRMYGDPLGARQFVNTGKPCSEPDCERPAEKRGVCGAHYQRWLKRNRSAPAPCTVDNCTRPALARGFCIAHYYRWSQYGDPNGRKPLNRDLTCGAADCTEPVLAAGLCQTHYDCQRNHGTTESPAVWLKAPSGQRWCGSCQKFKNLDEFFKQHTAKDGRAPGCKACRKRYDRQWRDDNPGKAKAKNRQARQRSRYRTTRSTGREERFTRLEIAARDGWLCQICLQMGRTKTSARISKTLRFPNPRSLSIDHIVPLAAGGAHTRANAQATHLGCNCAKQAGGTDQLRLIG